MRSKLSHCLFAAVLASTFIAVATRAVAEPVDDEYANIRTVAVVSALGSSIDLAKVGITVFDNERHMLGVSDWDLDANAARQVAAAISQRFTIKQIDADVSPLEKHGSDPDLKAFVRSLPAADGVDAYVIVYNFLCREQCGDTGVALWGLGLVHKELIFGGSRNAIFAYFGIAVVEAKSGKLIDYGTGHLSKGFLGLNMPFEQIDDSVWAATAEAMTSEQKEALKANFIPMLQLGISNALDSAHLANAKQ